MQLYCWQTSAALPYHAWYQQRTLARQRVQGREASAASHLRPIRAYVLQEFCKVILKHKAATAKDADEADTIDAFVALGGKPDKTGQISSGKLRATIKVMYPPVPLY